MAFTIVGEEELVRSKPIRLVTVEVRAPDGSELQRTVVRHPGAVAVVPLHDDGTVTLVRQYRAPVDSWVLEIPAGTCDVDGEPPEETARRELIEEAGLRPGRLEHLITFWNSPGYSDQQTMLYLATELTGAEPDRSHGEERWMEVERVAPADVAPLIGSGAILDGQTLLGLRLAADRLAGS